jgi:hypothetical protein
VRAAVLRLCLNLCVTVAPGLAAPLRAPLDIALRRSLGGTATRSAPLRLVREAKLRVSLIAILSDTPVTQKWALLLRGALSSVQELDSLIEL